MRLLVTGSTGVLGREVVPLLLARGDEVDAVVRPSTEPRPRVVDGARPLRLDLFDRAAVARSVRRVDGVVHLATAIPPLPRMHRPRAWRINDRLRRDVTATLVEAGIAGGVEVVLFPSITFNYADGGERWLDEDAALDPPFAPTRSALAAESHVQRLSAAGRRGVVLRLARLYGPGHASAELVEQARRGRAVVVGDGANLVSSLHVHDAASAILAGLAVPAGVYNIADDQPRRAGELAATIADASGGPPPRTVPRSVASLLIGRAVELLTRSQRVANGRFRAAAGWAPSYPDAGRWWADAGAEAPDRRRSST
jgi:nucleoside-diphosphate-sugar epimerase